MFLEVILQWNYITKIDSLCFENCNLESIVLPSKLKEIGDQCFRRCDHLISIQLPTTLTKLGDYAFDRCDSLKEITIPNGVNGIPHRCFSHCTSLTKIELPKNIAIGKNAFKDCPKLTIPQVN